MSGGCRGGPYVRRAVGFVSHHHIGHMLCIDRLGIVVAIEIACCLQGPLAHVLVHVVLQTLHACCVVDVVLRTRCVDEQCSRPTNSEIMEGHRTRRKTGGMQINRWALL